jgi:hypothetical protein
MAQTTSPNAIGSKAPEYPRSFQSRGVLWMLGIDERANGRLWNIGAVKIGLIPL